MTYSPLLLATAAGLAAATAVLFSLTGTTLQQKDKGENLHHVLWGLLSVCSARRQTHLVVVFSLLALLCRLFCWRANTEMGLLNRNEIRERNRQNDIEWKSRSVLKFGTWCTCNYNTAVCWKVDSIRAQQCENRKWWFQDNVSDGQLGRFYRGVQWFSEDPKLDNTVRGLTPLSLCVNILSGPAAKRKTEQPVTHSKCFSTCFWRQIASSCSLQQKSHYSQTKSYVATLRVIILEYSHSRNPQSCRVIGQ